MESDDLLDLAASAPAPHPRGPDDDELFARRVDASTWASDPAVAAIAFAEFIARRQPVVLTGCIDWPALRTWTHEYLKKTLGDRPVFCALTPDGLGDAVATAADGTVCFVKPYEARMPFSSFVDAIESPLHAPDGVPRRAVHYVSHQNDSLSSEYEALWADVELALPWADAAFGRPPAATNFWMGEDAARTTVHADLFDNVYCVVSGRKEFHLLPPQEGHVLRRQRYPSAAYTPSADGSSHALVLEFDEPAAEVLWSPVHLDHGSSEQLRPVRASVGPGEVLFLPALWWHAVGQRGGEGCAPSTVAVNYWYEGPTALGEEVEAAAERAAERILEQVKKM